MGNNWPKVKFGDFLHPNSRPYTLGADEDANLVGMRLYGGGPFHRELKFAMKIAKKSHFVIRAGDVIYNKLFAWKGTFGIVPPALDRMFVSDKFPTYELDRSRVDENWLRWYFYYPPLWEEAGGMSTGSAALSKLTLNPPKFLLLTMPLPPLAEQRRIVARIEELAAKVQKAQTLRQQATEQTEALLNGEISYVFDNLAKYPKTAIGTLGIGGENPVQTGPFGAQLHASDFVDQGVPVLNVGNVWPDGLRLDSLDHVLREKANQLNRYSLKSGDLLFARSGATLGKVCLVPDRCEGWLMSGHLFRVRFDDCRIYNRFAFAALRGVRSIHQQVFGQVRGATRPGYNTTLLGNVELPVPPLSEQRKVVAYLDRVAQTVSSLRSLQVETSGELCALMPSILDKAFRGEL